MSWRYTVHLAIGQQPKTGTHKSEHHFCVSKYHNENLFHSDDDQNDNMTVCVCMYTKIYHRIHIQIIRNNGILTHLIVLHLLLHRKTSITCEMIPHLCWKNAPRFEVSDISPLQDTSNTSLMPGDFSPVWGIVSPVWGRGVDQVTSHLYKVTSHLCEGGAWTPAADAGRGTPGGWGWSSTVWPASYSAAPTSPDSVSHSQVARQCLYMSVCTQHQPLTLYILYMLYTDSIVYVYMYTVCGGGVFRSPSRHWYSI